MLYLFQIDFNENEKWDEIKMLDIELPNDEIATEFAKNLANLFKTEVRWGEEDTTEITETNNLLGFKDFINEKNWIADAIGEKGALHKKLHIPVAEKIPSEIINKKLKTLKKKEEKSPAEQKLQKELVLAKTLKRFNK